MLRSALITSQAFGHVRKANTWHRISDEVACQAIGIGSVALYMLNLFRSVLRMLMKPLTVCVARQMQARHHYLSLLQMTWRRDAQDAENFLAHIKLFYRLDKYIFWSGQPKVHKLVQSTTLP